MHVRTPVPSRPPMPNVIGPYSGMGAFDLSQITGDIANIVQVIQQGEPGMYTVVMADGSRVTYRQPVGSSSNLPVGNVTGNIGTAVQGTVTAGTGVWILLGIGALLVFMGNRGRR